MEPLTGIAVPFMQRDQKVSVHLTITVQSSGAQRIFDHPVCNVFVFSDEGILWFFF